MREAGIPEKYVTVVHVICTKVVRQELECQMGRRKVGVQQRSATSSFLFFIGTSHERHIQ